MTETNSVHILECIDRHRAGDKAAANELFQFCGQRLEQLAQRMLGGFPSVRRHADTGDIVQGASMRLLNSLRELRPDSAPEFYSLAAMQIRRELLDLSRYIATRQTIGHQPGNIADSPERVPATDDIEQWAQFHEAVEKLPVEEREAIGLVFYHGKTRGEAAAILNVCEKTMQRWWQSACTRLNHNLGSDLASN